MLKRPGDGIQRDEKSIRYEVMSLSMMSTVENDIRIHQCLLHEKMMRAWMDMYLYSPMNNRRVKTNNENHTSNEIREERVMLFSFLNQLCERVWT